MTLPKVAEIEAMDRAALIAAWDLLFGTPVPKGLKGHKSSLLDAIRIMLDIGVAAEMAKEEDKERRRVFLEVGTSLGFLPRNDDD